MPNSVTDRHSRLGRSGVTLVLIPTTTSPPPLDWSLLSMTLRKFLPAAFALILPIAALAASPASAQLNAPKKHTHHIHKHLHKAKASTAPTAEKAAS